MALDQAETVIAKRLGTPTWARLLSWVVAPAVWLWIFIVLFFATVAIVMATFAIYLVHSIKWCAARLKLRFKEGSDMAKRGNIIDNMRVSKASAPEASRTSDEG